MTVFVLDTNVISDIVAPKPNSEALANFATHQPDTICLCEAIDYEVRRGFLKTGAVARLAVYDQTIKPQFQWVLIGDKRRSFGQTGKQLSDIDLLLAAVSKRLGGTLVSSFDGLPVTRVNWRLR